ncbi:MAG: hypothetical protein LBG87_00150 [Spirochaetaceae bacterium]|jgi:hypothetical protein|nr:hypothetical protein [Spirochaetaceae bacterium]
MKKIVGCGAAVIALVMLSVSCGSKPKEVEAPVEEPTIEPYGLPLSGFQAWTTEDGTSAVLEEDTIVFSGGGLDYLLPEDVDLSLYSGLYLTYVTSEWQDSADVEAKTGNPHRMQLSFKGWNGVEGAGTEETPAVRTDYTYPELADGPDPAEVSLIDVSRTREGAETDVYAEWINQEGVKGFTIKANVWENDGIPSYKVQIISLELRP